MAGKIGTINRYDMGDPEVSAHLPNFRSSEPFETGMAPMSNALASRSFDRRHSRFKRHRTPGLEGRIVKSGPTNNRYDG